MKILIAIDGSEFSLRALRRALELTSQFREPPAIWLINVHDDAALHHASHFVGRKAVMDYLQEQSQVDLAAAKVLLGEAGIEAHQIIRVGHVAKEIAAAAADGNFGLIVMGTKGRGAVADLLMGSVAQRLGALSPVPVLLVP